MLSAILRVIRLRMKWALMSLTLMGLTALAVWGVIALPTPVVDKMLETDLRSQSVLWERRVILHLDQGAEAFVTEELTPKDIEYLRLLPEASDVFRFKLFNAAGEVFWSTRPTDLGDLNTNAYFTEVLAKGGTHYKHETKPPSEIDGLALHVGATDSAAMREVAEVYTPIMYSGRFVGAIEFYSDIIDLRATFVQRIRISLAILASIALTVFAVIMWTMYRSSSAQMASLQGRTAKEREILDKQLQLAREVKLLGELNEWLQSSRSLDELFDMVAKFMTHMLPVAEGSVYVYSNSRDVLDGCASWNGGTHKDHIHPDGCWGLRRGRTYEYGSSEIDFVCEHAEPHDGRPYFCFPILAHGETVGLMHLRARSDAEADSFKDCKKTGPDVRRADQHGDCQCPDA